MYRKGYFFSRVDGEDAVYQVIIAILSTARGHYQPASFVFATFQNETGWPAGVAFILGLLQSTFGLTGFDAISHMIEEMPRES